MGTYQEKVMTFVDDIEMKDYALTLLGLMSEADRILVELYYFEGLKYKEIGKMFKVCGAKRKNANFERLVVAKCTF